MRKFLRWTALTIGALLLVVVVGVGAFVGFGIPVELSRFRAPVEQAASLAMGRKVTIDGSVSLAPSLEPTLQIEGVHAANTEGWSEPDLLFLELARVQLAVLPLLEGRVEVIEVAVDGFRANLERTAEDEVNWLIEARERTEKAPAEAPADDAAGAVPQVSMLEIVDLSLQNIAISLRDGGTGAAYQLTFDSIKGSAVDNQPMQLAIEGHVEEAPYSISVLAGSIGALLDGQPDWPVQISMTALGATLDIEGKLADPVQGAGMDGTFSLSGDDLQDLEAFIGQDLPPVKGYSFGGRVTDQDEAFGLEDFQARIGDTGFSGALSVVMSGERPELEGRLDIPTINVEHIFGAIESQQTTAPAAADDGSEFDLQAPVFALDSLRAFDGRFEMTVGEVVGAPTTIRSAALQVAVSNGVMNAPMQAEIAEVAFSGKLVLDGSQEVPQAAVALEASRTDIGNLADALLDIEGIEGGFEGARIEFSVAGESVADMFRFQDFAFRMTEATLSYGNRPGETPVGFTLDAAEMMLPRGEVLQITADGTVLEEPFSLAIAGAGVEQIMGRDPLPMELTASGGGATLAVKGTADELDAGGIAAAFELRGDRIGDLTRWLGVRSDADAPYAVAGTVSFDLTALSVDALAVQLGNTVLSGSVTRVERDAGPLTTVALSSDLLALGELSDLFPETDAADADAADEAGFSVDVPILPKGVELKDADLDLALKQVALKNLALQDITLQSSIREGRVADSPFGVTVAGARLDGSVSLDISGTEPSATFAVATDDIDIGDFLAQLGVIEDLEVSAGRMSLDLALKGATGRQMLERSQFEAQIAQARWTLRDPNLEGALEIGLHTGTVTAAPGQPVAMTLEGDIDTEPVTIGLRTAPLADFADEKDSLPLDLDIALAGAKLTLAAVAGLPVETRGLRFRLDLQGESLDRFDGLLDASLPPFGPYTLGGDFTAEPEGYRIDDFSMTVGESKLVGTFSFATAGVRPRLDVDLITETLQMDDFGFEGWSPLGEEDEEAAETEETDETKTAEAEAVDEAERARTEEEIRALLSPQVMRSLDARLNLKVDEVLSGADELGSGTLVSTLQDGRFEVSPLVVNIPGGSVEIELGYEPHDDKVMAEAQARIEKLDYGVLARRIDPESEVGGLISVDIDLKSQAENLDRVMAHANGHLDFAVWPKNLEASLFDLWAVNLVTSVLPSVDSEEQSKFNCMIARFKVEDGIMEPEAILVDSSRIQATGEGTVDFKQETVKFTMAPKAKWPQMFSANTPIAVNGSFDDFGVGIAPGSLVGTAVRFTTSPVTTPFLWVFSTPVAEDGVEACAEAWAREPEELLKEVKEPAASDAEQQQ